ncbi:MAG: DUF418 domain-containing protein [Bacteroidia bacterium]|nr:DUF418 domain-containing protein [Bacteroidia bacterium]
MNNPVSSRIYHLDVLRGFAILGILIMNIPDFAIIEWQNSIPPIFEGRNNLNFLSWEFSYIFLDGKMRGILSILFGASILLFTAKKETQFGLSTAKAYYRRMFWLLMICLFACYLFFCFTTILYEYALCGALLYFVRNLNYKWLIGFGVICLLTISWMSGEGFEKKKEMRENYKLALLHKQEGKIDSADIKALTKWKLRQKQIIEALAEAVDYSTTQMQTVHAGYLTMFPVVALLTTDEIISSLPFGILESLGTILIGMGLFKIRYLRGELKNSFYLISAFILLIAGTFIGYIRFTTQNALISGLSGAAYDHVNINIDYIEQIHRLLFVFGYISLFIFFTKKAAFTFLTKPLQCVGQMAISNYIFQNFMFTLIFFGYGLDLYQSVERYQLFLIASIIWTIQIIFTINWLKYYQVGPVEWLWRSLIYWRKMPLKRVVYS